MGSFRTALVGLVAVVCLAGCGGDGPDAPALGASSPVCAPDFCVEVPEGWTVVEQTDDHVSLSHPADESIGATVSHLNVEALVTANGLEWPQTSEVVLQSFWALIDEGEAELQTTKPLVDGSVTSFGTFGDGRMWFRLIPTGPAEAIAAEVRAPNSSWAEHAEAVTGSVTETP